MSETTPLNMFVPNKEYLDNLMEKVFGVNKDTFKPDSLKQLQYTIEKETHWDKTQINKMV